MKFKLGVAIISAFLAFSCDSEDNSEDNKTNSNPDGKVDVSDFKNSADEELFASQGDAAKGVFTGVGEKVEAVAGTSFSASFFDGHLYNEDKCTAVLDTTATIPTCEYENDDGDTISCTFTSAVAPPICTTDATDTDTDTSGGDSDFDFAPDASAMAELFSEGFDNCNEAFKGIKSLYADSEEKLAEMLKELTEAGDLQEGVKLKKIEDPNSAIAYEYEAPETDGLNISGNIKGSADDSMVVIERALNIEIDFSKFEIPTGNAFALIQTEADTAELLIKAEFQEKVFADLDKKIIDFVSDGTTSVNTLVTTFKAVTTVEGGDLPIVHTSMDVTVAGAPAGQEAANVASKVDMTMEMTDEDTIKISGTIGVTGAKPVTVAYSSTVSKGADGKCTITEDIK